MFNKTNCLLEISDTYAVLLILSEYCTKLINLVKKEWDIRNHNCINFSSESLLIILRWLLLQQQHQ